MTWITVFKAFSPAQAHIIRSRLETAGFHAKVDHELSALSNEGYSMATGGIRVKVPDHEAKEARDLITAEESGS